MGEQLTMLTEQAAREISETMSQHIEADLRQYFWAIDNRVPKALGMSEEEWTAHYYSPQKLAVQPRAKKAKELVDEGYTQRQIARALGVDPATVSRDLNPPVANATPAAGIQPQDEMEGVADATPDEEPDIIDGEAEEETEGSEPLTTRQLLAQSDQNDWRTPRKFLEAARAVMGDIDLDPATSTEANETVRATTIYTEEEDGLSQPWKGRVWLNPPYGGQARLFVERAVKEYQVGNVTAACLLVNSHPTETKWFQDLFDYHICFIRGRIDFGGPSREVSSSSTHGSAIVYMGEHPDRFVAEFGRFGKVVSAR